MTKKMTDKAKVEKIKLSAARALRESKYNQNRMEVLGYAIGTLAHIFAILDADKEDEQSINFVAAEVLAEVTGRAKQEHFPADARQLELGESLRLSDEVSNKNSTRK